jgi:hypothetical protein
MRVNGHIALLASMLIVGCGGTNSSSPAAPAAPAPTIDIGGVWSGTAADEGGPGTLTWQVTQSSNRISGTVSSEDRGTGLKSSGSLSGTLAGSSLTFTIAIPAGGYSGVNSCNAATANLSGSATASAGTISGSYSGPVCGGNVNGTFELHKQ